MSARKSQRPPPPAYFYTEKVQLPIAGLPAAKPCPFCNSNECIVIQVEEKGDDKRLWIQARAECWSCGCVAGESTSNDPEVKRRSAATRGMESLAYFTAMEVAERWNRRPKD